MEPALSWVTISRERLTQAARVIEDRGTGVLDEVGVLEVHRAFADRFFPGTSVLHTRLRYSLFVPWIYLDVQRGYRDTTRSDELVRRFAHEFRTRQWPWERRPEVYYDPRSLDPDRKKRSALHAKCIVVDEALAFAQTLYQQAA